MSEPGGVSVQAASQLSEYRFTPTMMYRWPDRISGERKCSVLIHGLFSLYNLLLLVSREIITDVEGF